MHYILRLPVVEAKSGLRHSEIYKRVGEGTFPRPVKLGAKAVGWIESEIDEWIQNRVAERDNSPHRPRAAPAQSGV